MSADLHLFLSTLLMLAFGHFLADFPLQGEFVSKAKNPATNPAPIWMPVMVGHCTIHSGIVYALTGELRLAAFMFVTHLIIDVLKCVGWLGTDARAFLVDQLWHAVVLILIAGVYCSL